MKQRNWKVIMAVGALSTALASGVMIGQATARQPHMQRALDDLQSARSELQGAERNKGGHRAEALRLTNEAIRETQAGIDAAEDW